MIQTLNLPNYQHERACTNIHRNTPARTHKEQTRHGANLKTKETLKTGNVRSENKDQNIISRSVDEMNLSLKR